MDAPSKLLSLDLLYHNRYITYMQKTIRARFYRNPDTGTQPVKDWLLELPEEERRRIGRDICQVELG